MFSWRHVVRVVSLPPCFVLECFQILHGYPTCVQLQDLLIFVTVAFSRNFFFHGSSRGNPRWMEKLECLPAALMFSRKILLRLTRLCSYCSSSTAGVFASYSGNADDAQLAISAATSNVRLLCTNMYGFVPLADRITVGPLLSPFAEMCQVKRNLHPHHGGTLVCSSIDSMIMQRVIFRSLPIFPVLNSVHLVWTTLNWVSCFLIFPRSRLRRQSQCVSFAS